jgi:transposase
LGAIVTVAQMLGPQAGTVRKLVRRAEIDRGSRPGRSSEAVEELRRLRREKAELRRAKIILKAAASFFGADLNRHSK